jgi:hypothetical protein
MMMMMMMMMMIIKRKKNEEGRKSLIEPGTNLNQHRALYLLDDPYKTSDAVFGVKDSLLVDLGKIDAKQSAQYGIPEGSWLMTYDFVLPTQVEVSALRDKNSREALDKLGRKVSIINGLPVPDVD